MIPEQPEDSKLTIKVRIMQREFSISCREDERADLLKAAEYLDSQMRLISDSGKVLGMDRCAIMAGLNIAHTLLKLQQNLDQQANVHDRLRSLNDQIDRYVTDG